MPTGKEDELMATQIVKTLPYDPTAALKGDSRNWMRRHADRDAVQPRARQVTNPTGIQDWRNQGEGSGPEGVRQGPSKRAQLANFGSRIGIGKTKMTAAPFSTIA